MRRKAQRTRKIGLEMLESRAMLSVSATLIDGGETLFVKGDRGNNIIDLVSDDGSTIAVNGLEPISLEGVSLILINTGKGQDDVTLDLHGVTADVDLDTGKGEDVVFGSVDITGNLDVKTGNDKDTIDLVFAVTGNVSINAGAGHNDLGLENLIGSVSGNLDIQTGRGNDKIALGTEDDVLDIGGNLTLRASKGNDTVDLTNVTVHVNASMDGGPGNDTLNEKTFDVDGDELTVNFD